MILRKENGETKVITSNELKLLKGKIQKCSGCANGHANKCPKIAHIFATPEELEDTPYIPKQTIDKYSFITEGYQTVDNEGNVKDFIVTECANYEEAKEKKLTPEEKARVKKALEYMMLYYTDAGTIEDASNVLASQYEKGLYTHTRKKQ